MRIWWQGKTSRERILILFMMAACLMAGVWYGIVTPFNKGLARLAQDNARLTAELQWLDNAAQRKGLIPFKPSTLSMEQRLASTAKQYGIQYQSQKRDPKTLSISLAPLPASTFFTWLQALQHNGLQVTQLEFVAQPAGKKSVKVVTLQLRQVNANG